MDSHIVSTQQEQIALYGLFGDSTATLQGLNDHLSPSSLQQSPPCGSTQAANLPLCSPVIMSPRAGGTSGTRTHRGVLLSDLAERSPGAGSVSASAICSYVSYDNLRCTYLVESKGNRFCCRHSKEQAQKDAAEDSRKKSLLHSPTISLAQTIRFITPSTESSHSQSSSVQAPLKAVRTVKVDVKSLAPVLMKRGVDVPDRCKCNVSNQPSALSGKQVSKGCFARKVGHQITVATRSPSAKGGVRNFGGVSLGQNTTAAQQIPVNLLKSNLNGSVSQPRQQVGLNVGTVVSQNIVSASKFSLNSPMRKGTETVQSNVVKPRGIGLLNNTNSVNGGAPVFIKQKLQSNSLQSGSKTHSSVTAKPIQSLVVDEGTLKTLVNVLNSQSDLQPHDQISLLRSLGITIVQAPSTNNNITLLPTVNQLGITKKATPVKMPNPAKQWASPGVVNSDAASNQHTIPTMDCNPATKSDQQSPKSRNKKATVKRKPKKVNDEPGASKKAKPSTWHPGEAKAVAAEAKCQKSKDYLSKCKSTQAHPVKSFKAQSYGSDSSTVYLPFCPEEKRLEVSENAPAALKQFAALVNSRILLNQDVFELGPVPLDTDSETEGATEGNKLTKAKLLKKHIRKRKRGASVVRNSRPLKDDGIVSSLLHHLTAPEISKTAKNVHPEEVLSSLLERKQAEAQPAEPLFTDDEISKDIYDSDDMHSKARLEYTLKTKRLKMQYRDLKKDLKRAESELGLLVSAFRAGPTPTKNVLAAIVNRPVDRRIPNGARNGSKLCHLSTNGNMACSMLALPYSHYCKQHIWHCKSQYLYKLDKNMTCTADIEPEPLVKKTRKRTKLLPLIKRYKKKKRKKALQGEGEADVSNKEGSPYGHHCLKKGQPRNFSTEFLPSSRGSGLVSTRPAKVGANGEEGDPHDPKPSDTEEVLHLTGQEIMLSGVLDKLPEDLHDFDLFTTDKGAEELGRMLAASSPGSEFDEDDCDSIQNGADSASDVPSALKNPAPDVIVYNGNNDQNKAPPSFEALSNSQCVHYTFGSTFTMSDDKKENVESAHSAKASDYGIEEESTPIISAEDLQDIEGVLESLQKDVTDVHSPKLPSSPAVDHYTSMLARQLSQEVETESRKQRLGSGIMLDRIKPATTSAEMSLTMEDAKGPALTRSFSLPVSNGSETGKSVFTVSPTMQKNASAKQNLTHSGISTMTGKFGMSINDDSIPMSVANTTKHQPVKKVAVTKITAKTVCPGHKKDFGLNPNESANTGVGGSVSVSSPRKAVKKNTRKHVQTAVNVSTSGVTTKPQQAKSQAASAVVSNQVVPLTFMQGSNQGGNVVKLFVQPSAVMSGSGSSGTQNMLLIPVNALVRSDVVAGNQTASTSFAGQAVAAQTVKTQLSSLQAGQQFFIVNNSSGASTQPHLTLVQKTDNLTSRQQALILNPVNSQAVMTKNLLDAQSPTSSIQKPANLTAPKPVLYNIKPNYGTHSTANQKGFTTLAEKQPLITAATPGKAKAKTGALPPSSAPTASVRSIALPQSVAQNSGSYKFPTGQLNILSIPKAKGSQQPRKPKAKFDPVTKKYVSNVTKTQTTPLPLPQTVTVSRDRPIPKSALKEFNASTLSIQCSKVQQINSVLSSLNSGRMNGGTVHNIKQTDNRNTAKRNIKVLSTSTSTSTISMTAVSNGSPKNAKGRKKAPSVSVGNSSLEGTSTRLVATSQVGSGGVAVSQSTAGHTVKKLSTANGLPNNDAAPVPATTKTEVETPTSSGTVHWNQTTTAGPEIVSTTMTVPVYVAGSLPVGAWPSELAISGASMPIVFPVHKIRPNYQVPQRVVLRNIGSLGLMGTKAVLQTNTSASTSSSASEVISNGQSFKVGSTTAVSRNSDSSNTVTSVTRAVGTMMSPKQAHVGTASTSVPPASVASVAVGNLKGVRRNGDIAILTKNNRRAQSGMSPDAPVFTTVNGVSTSHD